MPTFYLGAAKDGRVISRKSTNPNFTHAAIGSGDNGGRLPSFSTSAAGALRNAESNYLPAPIEVVEVRKVEAADFRVATKGLDARSR